MRAPGVKSYSPPFELGKPITNFAVSKVLRSNNPNFSEGEVITGM
jgi:NADPH-dependent curcumin reductase CurA